MKTYNLAFDFGFGNSKMAIVMWNRGQARVRTSVIPSVVGLGNTEIGDLSMGSIGRQRRRDLPTEVCIDGATYLVGKNVHLYAEPLQSTDYRRLRGGPEMQALFYASVYNLLGPGQHRANVLVGLPVEVMADAKRSKATLRSLNEWMATRHRFAVEGEEIEFVVHEVQALPQPVGALFAWGMSDSGQWMRGAEALRSPTAVLDIGFNSIDLFGIESAEVSRRYTDGDTLGMRRAAEHLLQQIEDAYGLEFSLHEADALLRESNPAIYTRDGRQDVTSLVDRSLRKAASGILSYVTQPDRWGSGRRFARILVTGGGGAALKDVLVDEFPHCEVLAHPVEANAIGLARYAPRVFQEK